MRWARVHWQRDTERDARLKKAASEAEEEIAAYRAAKEAEYQAEVDKVRASPMRLCCC